MFTKHFSLKLFIIITIPLAVIIFLLGGFWYLKSNKNLEWGNLVLKGGQKQTASSSEEIDTSNWKTYRNEEYGFEVKYPGHIELNPQYITASPTSLGLNIAIDKINFMVSDLNFIDSKNFEEKLYRPMYFVEVDYSDKSPKERWIEGKKVYQDNIKSIKNTESECKRDDNFLVCYYNYISGGFISRHDIIYKNNKRLEFVTDFNGFTRWFSDDFYKNINNLDDINKNQKIIDKQEEAFKNYFSGNFNKEEANVILLLEKIKSTLKFF